MEPINVRDIKADGNARIHVGNSSVTHVHHYAEAPEQPETPPAPFSLIPFSRDPDFIARSELWDQIATHCSQPAGRAALVGLGGVGKSQLAIEYSHQTAEKQNGNWVFWVHAGTRARVEEGLRAIADAVKLPGRHTPKADIPHLLYTWLSNESNGKWFMILDSADDADVFYGAGSGSGQPPLAAYLPQSPNGSILVTTRDQSFAVRLTGNYKNIIKVGPMKPEEGISFLEKKLGALSEPDAGAELVRALDCIPLAINQAASYIQARAPRTTIKKYLAEFKESDRKSAKLLAHDAAELRRDGSSSNAIMKTWQISFDHIRSKQPSAADLLALMSFFDNQAIPESALNIEDEYDSDCESDLKSNCDSDELANHASLTRLMEAKKRREQPESDDDDDLASEPESGFEEDVALLRDYCLISVRESGTQFEMHRLVQLATKKWLATSKRQEEFKQLFISRLAMSAPALEGSNELILRDLIVHFRIAIEYRPNKTNLRFWYWLCYSTAWYMGYMEQYEESISLLQRGLDALGARKGQEHHEYLSGRTLLATFMVELESFKISESEAILLEVLETQKRVLPKGADDIMVTMIWLAENYQKQEKFEEAEKLQKHVIEERTAALGSEHGSTLHAMSALSMTYYYQLRYEEAEKIGSQVLDLTRKIYGQHHYETMARMADLAAIYAAQLRYDEALALDLQAINLKPASCQVEDQASIAIKMRLAEIYHSLSYHEKSLALDEEIVKLLTAKFGPDHEEILTVTQDIAHSLKCLGKYQESEEIYKMLLAKLRIRFDLQHPTAARCIMHLSRLYLNQYRPHDAEKILLEFLDARKHTLPPSDNATLDAMVLLATAYERQKLSRKASDLFSEVLALCKESSDMDYLSSLSIWRSFAGAIVSDQGQLEDLERILHDLLAFREDKYGPDDSLTIASLIPLAEIKLDLERWEEAAALHFRVLQSYEQKHGKTHRRTLECMIQLSRDRRQQGLFDEAKRLQKFVIETRKQKLGTSDRYTLIAMEELARTMEDEGLFKEAALLYKDVIQGYESLFTVQGADTVTVYQRLAYTVSAQAEFEESLREEAAKLIQDALDLTILGFGEGTYEVWNFARMAAWNLAKMEFFDKAANLEEAAYHGFKKLFGPDSSELLLCTLLLADILDSQGEYVKAMEVQRECLRLHQRRFGIDHVETIFPQERWDEWVEWLEKHVTEHAEEADHLRETCQACLACETVRAWGQDQS